MKTFKLKQLITIIEENESLIEKEIPLVDGLVIDCEDDQENWLIEVYMAQDHFAFFQSLKDEDSFLIKVKISKESNDPAFFIVKVVNMKGIVDHFNVLLKGQLIKRKTKDISTWIHQLIKEGYQGEQLIFKLKGKV